MDVLFGNAKSMLEWYGFAYLAVHVQEIFPGFQTFHKSYNNAIKHFMSNFPKQRCAGPIVGYGWKKKLNGQNIEGSKH